MLLTLIKKASGLLGDGAWLSGHPLIEPLVLERDYAAIDALLAAEEWPFLRGDFEISQRQPGAVALVARKEGRFAGFFTTHTFGRDVAYLDMMVIAPEFRRAGVARPLYFTAMSALRRNGARSFVVHSTNDSARLIRLLGFRPGRTFTLLRREAQPVATAGGVNTEREGGAVISLGKGQRESLMQLDAATFGRRRDAWIDALLASPEARFLGLVQGSSVVASICLRDRREGALALDGASAQEFAQLEVLVRHVSLTMPTRRLECFAVTGSRLHGLLTQLGFEVPAFFVPIGPLTEWRKGTPCELGASPALQSLSWL